MSKHALKIEALELTETKANAIVEAIRDFLLTLGYSEERISELECRSRDGFSPFSHNNGGLEAAMFSPMFTLPNGFTGFPNADATIEQHRDYDIKEFEERFSAKYEDFTEEQREEFYDAECNDDSTVLFSVDVMLNSENELNVRMCVSAKDSPYHRKYDDLVSVDVEFRSVSDLKAKLAKLLKRTEFGKFSDNLRDAY
jgi:hypothetical protein